MRFLSGLAAIAVTVGIVVMTPERSSSILAQENVAELSTLLSPDGMAVASRGESTSVAPPPTTAPEVVDEAAEVVRLTNIERVAAGVAPLTVHPSLNVAAATHANDQRTVQCAIGFFSHTGTDGSNAADRILRTGLDISRWGENIGCGQRTAASIVRGWMESAGHRANLLNPKLTHIGAAMAQSSTGQRYWVQVLGTPR